MSRVAFEHKTPVFERAKTVHAVKRASTVIGNLFHSLSKTRVEAGLNTSTVTLRVVRGDEMGIKKPLHSLSG
jgi:hypothetical protein